MDQKSETVDFAYVIDCTGSMSSYIEQTKNNIKDIVTKMNNNYPQFDLRLGCVAYRDWSEDGNRLQSSDFTQNVESFKSWLGTVKAFGGGDAPEDVLGGLQKATQLDWTSKLRIVFHICDAPPHHTMYHDLGKASDTYPDGHPSDPSNYHQIVLDKMREKNIHLCIAKLNGTVAKMITVFQNYGKKIDLTIEERSVSNASGLLEAVEKALGALAKIRMQIRDAYSECTNLDSSMKALAFDSKELIEKAMVEIEKIDSGITRLNRNVDQVSTEVDAQMREYEGLKSTQSVLMAYARSCNTKAEIESAEDKIMNLQLKLTDTKKEFSDSQAKLNESLHDLMKASTDLGTVDATTTTDTAEKHEKATKIKGELTGLIGKLSGMEKSDDRDALRKGIKKQLREMNKLFDEDTKVKEKILNLRKEILKTFKDVSERSKDVSEAKRDVKARLEALDDILDELDDRDPRT